MKQEIYINSTPQESRIALIEDGQLAEFLIERKEEMGVAGNIYKGKVARVLPGMQAAFIDIGMEKAGFLHASDFSTEPEDVQLIGSSGDDVEFESSGDRYSRTGVSASHIAAPLSEPCSPDSVPQPSTM